MIRGSEGFTASVARTRVPAAAEVSIGMSSTEYVITGAALMTMVVSVIAARLDRFRNVAAGLIVLLAGLVPWLAFSAFRGFVGRSGPLWTLGVFGSAPL